MPRGDRNRNSDLSPFASPLLRHSDVCWVQSDISSRYSVRQFHSSYALIDGKVLGRCLARAFRGGKGSWNGSQKWFSEEKVPRKPNHSFLESASPLARAVLLQTQNSLKLNELPSELSSKAFIVRKSSTCFPLIFLSLVLDIYRALQGES